MGATKRGNSSSPLGPPGAIPLPSSTEIIMDKAVAIVGSLPALDGAHRPVCSGRRPHAGAPSAAKCAQHAAPHRQNGSDSANEPHGLPVGWRGLPPAPGHTSVPPQ